MFSINDIFMSFLTIIILIIITKTSYFAYAQTKKYSKNLKIKYLNELLSYDIFEILLLIIAFKSLLFVNILGEIYFKKYLLNNFIIIFWVTAYFFDQIIFNMKKNITISKIKIQPQLLKTNKKALLISLAFTIATYCGLIYNKNYINMYVEKANIQLHEYI
tara:strand:+ start:65 stop:547 length:483 start_codon:yes stop_codon:yes gene_type:complete